MSIIDVVYYGLAALALLAFLSAMVLVLTWVGAEGPGPDTRCRMGPMRVGFHGDPTAGRRRDEAGPGKRTYCPPGPTGASYWTAPLAVFVPAFAIWVTIPISRDIVLRNIELGLFYIVAVSVLSVLGLVMAGWGSANKYAVLGGLRAAGQLISYEIPFIMAALAVAMLTQSLDLTQIVDGQGIFANALIQPLGLFLFFTAGLAELGRTPFDIHHAESEVVGRSIRGVQRGALGRLSSWPST